MLTNLRKSRLTNLNQKLNPKKNQKRNKYIIQGGIYLTEKTKQKR